MIGGFYSFTSAAVGALLAYLQQQLFFSQMISNLFFLDDTKQKTASVGTGKVHPEK